MRISDWSSDVCSSDLRVAGRSLLCPATAALPYQAAEPPELVRAIGCSCVASPVAQALVGAAQPVPVPEIEAEVAVIVTVMAVMMAGRDQPFADPPVHRRSGEKLPTHVIGDAEEGHDRQHGEQRREMDRDDEHQKRNDDCPDKAFPWVKAHRRPGGDRKSTRLNSSH